MFCEFIYRNDEWLGRFEMMNGPPSFWPPYMCTQAHAPRRTRPRMGGEGRDPLPSPGGSPTSCGVSRVVHHRWCTGHFGTSARRAPLGGQLAVELRSVASWLYMGIRLHVFYTLELPQGYKKRDPGRDPVVCCLVNGRLPIVDLLFPLYLLRYHKGYRPRPNKEC